MTHKAASTATSVNLNAYRVANPVHRCLTANCSEVAMVRCLRCGSTGCSKHAQVSGYCVDCEMKLSNIQARGGWMGSGVAAVGAVSSLYVTGLNYLPLSVVLSACFILLGVWTAAMGRALAKNRFKAGDKFSAEEMMLEGASLEIAPRMAGPMGVFRRRRSVAGSGGRSAGAMPFVPMYQRTYGVG